MAIDITMPRLSDSMEEGVVAKWYVEVGATVERGQLLAEIDTDKATMDFEADAAGTILELLVQEGESAPIGAPIARLGAVGETLPPPPADVAGPPAAERTVRQARPEVRRAKEKRANASPVARRLAVELGVDLSAIEGSGPGGAITKDDVQRAAAAGAAEPPSSTKGGTRLEELSRIQRAVARRMVEGASMPSFAVEVEIDMSAVVALRAELTDERESAPSLNDFVVKATALALREFPRLNGSYTERGFELYSRINVGFAVAAEDSLVVPTIFDADAKTLSEIASESRRLADAVRGGTVVPAELDGGTFTVTNLGMFGATRFLPILNPPQAAILAIGTVTMRARFDDQGAVIARDVMNATLVGDHRIAYGADAARFLARVRELLEQPAELLDRP
jgi:pyruvate dehydrogenase E2 component (dihydrolipoamide acetyltransferase)